jgi:Penicillin V acylase and related amidases
MALNAVMGSLVVVCLSNLSVYACTIFTLTDTNQALFCNNEDWKDPNTRIWFVPSRRGRYGCAYVGFDNGWAQGGLNSDGLAYEWVAGHKARWQRDPKMMSIEGNPAQRMLESSATVEGAIAFFQTHWEPSFEYARILIADRTGASVIIGAKDG